MPTTTISEQINAIITDRNTIRNKLVSLGLSKNTDKLSDLASDINSIINRGSPNASVAVGESYSISAGYYTGGTVTGIAGEGRYLLENKGKIAPDTYDKLITPTQGYYGIGELTIEAIPSHLKDVSGVDATAADVLSNKKIVTSTGALITGTMLNNGAVAPTALNCDGSYTIPAGYHNGSGVVTAASLASQTGVITGKTAIAAKDVLTGHQGWVNGEAIYGTMPNRGGVEPPDLDCGDSYTIPAGYHNGYGVVTAASLASQTGVDTDKTAAVSSMLRTGYQAWVNGLKVTGSMIDCNVSTDVTVTGGNVATASGANPTYYVVYRADTEATQAGYMDSNFAIIGTPAKLGIQAGENGGNVSKTLTGLGSVSGDSSVTLSEGYYKSITVALDNTILTALQSI